MLHIHVDMQKHTQLDATRVSTHTKGNTHTHSHSHMGTDIMNDAAFIFSLEVQPSFKAQDSRVRDSIGVSESEIVLCKGREDRRGTLEEADTPRLLVSVAIGVVVVVE